MNKCVSPFVFIMLAVLLAFTSVLSPAAGAAAPGSEPNSAPAAAEKPSAKAKQKEPPEAGPGTPPRISAQSAALIDVESGRILYAKNSKQPMRIASLTKIMTAIVAIEQGKLSDMVKVSRNAAGKEGSSIYLKVDEEMSLQNLLFGLMLRSGNDAATAIAEHVGGSVEGFAVLMNQKAQFIGMKNSEFQNPHGLDQDGHLSTAEDMALLTAYALKNPVFLDIVKTKEKRVPNPGGQWDHVWKNKNKMLSLYDGANGVKTGYTKTAGRCLVSSAARDGRELAVVTLGDPDDWLDHSQLLDYGFQTFQRTEMIQKGDSVLVDRTAYAQLLEPADTHASPGQPPKLAAVRGFAYPLLPGEQEKITRRILLTPPGSPAYRLEERGLLELELDGVQIGTVPLAEPGSWRMQWKPRSVFSFQASQSAQTWRERYAGVVEQVLRVLFTVIYNPLGRDQT
ncbi:D-alanyl-D-alanine carboxypeptidase family protein [Paenibacillus sp. y28]|uniref:D-alanyl-D-alanine carboxypeptidase family protein n=1 Tax=Paenibacillus sp. y28 TaxID=3129110 RepID=UPI003016F2B9